VMKDKFHSGWRTVKLGEVCELNPRRPKLDRAANTPTSFVQMSAVAENGGGIVRPETRPFGQVSKGYTFFAEGDVIFAKITPCMQNGKHAIARNLLDGIGFGSTEFHVFRPGGEIISEWILNFLLQPSILTEATRHFTGAVGQQRVPENVLANLEIPLPPKDEQRRIAGRLQEQMAAVERARTAVQNQLDTAQKLPAALLRAVFTSPAAHRWPRKSFGELVANFDGVRIPLKHTDRNKREGKYPYYGASGIIDQIDDFRFDGEFLLIGEDGANLLSRSTPIAFRAKGKFWVNNHAHVVQPKSGTRIEWLEHFFAATDLQAMGGLKAARDLGLRVPEDLGVIGFDDLDMADYIDLTTIRQHLDESGRIAVELLLSRLADPQRPIQHVHLPLVVVERLTA